jgi:hypothetical protein
MEAWLVLAIYESRVGLTFRIQILLMVSQALGIVCQVSTLTPMPNGAVVS